MSAAIVVLPVALIGIASPLASEQPLVQAAFAYPLSWTGTWSLAGWGGTLRESGLIACVGAGLIAAASLVRRTT